MAQSDFCDYIEEIEKEMKERYVRIESVVKQIEITSLLKEIKSIEEQSIIKCYD